MAISSDYPRPVTVNGFVCRNCDDVSKAKRNIDPAERETASVRPASELEAVSFGGSLADTRRVTQPVAAQETWNRLDRYA